MDSTGDTSGKIGVYFSREQIGEMPSNGSMASPEAISHFENLMESPNDSVDELSVTLRQFADPNALTYENLLRFQSQLAAKGIHWNLEQVRQAVLEARKTRNVRSLESEDMFHSNDQMPGFFEGLGVDVEKFKQGPLDSAKLLRLQATLAEKQIYWNFISKLADKEINALQTLMSSQV